MSKPDVKLIMVTEANNNKFYNMHDNNDGTFTVIYGRVGTDGSQITYSISEWDKKLNEKLKKGYKDVTDHTAKISSYAEVSDQEINKLLNAFLEHSRQFVSSFTNSTTISNEAADEAQQHINNLAKNIDIPNPTNLTLNAFNKELLKLFEIIPRKMSRVNDALCKNLNDRPKFVFHEQSLLDNLINISKNLPKSSGTQTIEEAFGFAFSKCSQKEIDFIKDKLKQDGFYRYKFNRAFKINTPNREKGFDKYLEDNGLVKNDKNIKFYWHGTGTENILSILSTGLLIHPSNASYTGSMFGNGIYTAPNADKASGYTSIAGSYWKGGANNVAYMFLNAVITGNSFDAHSNREKYGNYSLYNLDGDKFSSQNLGYHSVYAHSGVGTGLRRDEVIVYNQNQVACRYLVEFTV